MAFCLVIFGLMSCKKDLSIGGENTLLEKNNHSNPNSTAAIVSSYDHFYDGMDWSFTNSPSIPGSPGAWTLCGYASNYRWGRLSWNWTACPLDPSLASSSAGYLQLQSPGNFLKKGAQIETIRQDYSFGSYRAKIKAGANSSANSSQGSCSGFFFYNVATEQEIDVEILNKEHTSKKVHFSTHPGNWSQVFTLSSDPTTSFIEYGFDWYADKIEFFVDGTKVNLPGTPFVPSVLGKIILNNWTGNSWAGSPPPNASNMSVDYISHVPFLVVTYPDASGIVWTEGTSKTITWNKYGDVASGNVIIELWKNGSFCQAISSSSPNTGAYNWTIPRDLPTVGNYQIKIKSILNSKYFDLSNNGFTIQKKLYLD